jgi:transcriptional regulator GlxA family with amidase domain
MTHTIAFLVFDNFQLLDATGPIGAFERPMHMLEPPPYRLAVIAQHGGLVRSSAGVALEARAWRGIRDIDTLIIAGGEGTRQAAVCPATLAFVRSQAEKARRICSVCSGSYILAEAGLLAGRRATTHWRRSAHFQSRYPETHVEADRIYTRDGKIWTSAGITAGIDLALALIADDLGDDIAKRAAQELVVYHRRPGGQSQFSALLDIAAEEEKFKALLSWMRDRLAEPLTVERLAEQACMSPRNFARAFARSTGMTPAKAVERLRLEVARERLGSCDSPLSRIASACGFGDTERMRRAFLRSFGQTPQALRRGMRGSAPPPTPEAPRRARPTSPVRARSVPRGSGKAGPQAAPTTPRQGARRAP